MLKSSYENIVIEYNDIKSQLEKLRKESEKEREEYQNTIQKLSNQITSQSNSSSSPIVSSSSSSTGSANDDISIFTVSPLTPYIHTDEEYDTLYNLYTKVSSEKRQLHLQCVDSEEIIKRLNIDLEDRNRVIKEYKKVIDDLNEENNQKYLEEYDYRRESSSGSSLSDFFRVDSSVNDDDNNNNENNNDSRSVSSASDEDDEEEIDLRGGRTESETEILMKSRTLSSVNYEDAIDDDDMIMMNKRMSIDPILFQIDEVKAYYNKVICSFIKGEIDKDTLGTLCLNCENEPELNKIFLKVSEGIENPTQEVINKTLGKLKNTVTSSLFTIYNTSRKTIKMTRKLALLGNKKNKHSHHHHHKHKHHHHHHRKEKEKEKKTDSEKEKEVKETTIGITDNNNPIISKIETESEVKDNNITITKEEKENNDSINDSNNSIRETNEIESKPEEQVKTAQSNDSSPKSQEDNSAIVDNEANENSSKIDEEEDSNSKKKSKSKKSDKDKHHHHHHRKDGKEKSKHNSHKQQPPSTKQIVQNTAQSVLSWFVKK